jgi:hypothetical protein
MAPTIAVQLPLVLTGILNVLNARLHPDKQDAGPFGDAAVLLKVITDLIEFAESLSQATVGMDELFARTIVCDANPGADAREVRRAVLDLAAEVAALPSTFATEVEILRQYHSRLVLLCNAEDAVATKFAEMPDTQILQIAETMTAPIVLGSRQDSYLVILHAMKTRATFPSGHTARTLSRPRAVTIPANLTSAMKTFLDRARAIVDAAEKVSALDDMDDSESCTGHGVDGRLEVAVQHGATLAIQLAEVQQALAAVTTAADTASNADKAEIAKLEGNVSTLLETRQAELAGFTAMRTAAQEHAAEINVRLEKSATACVAAEIAAAAHVATIEKKDGELSLQARTIATLRARLGAADLRINDTNADPGSGAKRSRVEESPGQGNRLLLEDAPRLGTPVAIVASTTPVASVSTLTREMFAALDSA